MADHDDILRKVRALLTQAEDPGCTPEEAKTFSAAAQRLIAKYAIEEALLRGDATSGRGEPGITVIRIKEGDLEEGSCELLWMVSRFNRCRAIRFSQREIGYIQMEIIGFANDREITQLLHSSLGIQSLTEMMSGDVLKGRGSKKGKATSFMKGYVEEVGRRLEEATKRAERDVVMESGKSSDSVALALISDKQKVDEWVKERYPHLGHYASRTAFNQAAYGAGRAAGQRADLGGGKVGGGSRGELSR